jgi:selenocysteine lyase/cysteine desulfurase
LPLRCDRALRRAVHAQNVLYEAGIEVPVKCIQHTLYVRVSAHIYNEREDYRVLAAAVKGLAVA